MNDPFRYLHMPPELVWEFPAVFSRMEYALKATGGYATDASSSVAAAWDRFANDIDKSFRVVEDKYLKSAAAYLLDNATRRQVLQNGVMTFIDQIVNNNQTKTQQTLLMGRTVRNNFVSWWQAIAFPQFQVPGTSHARVERIAKVLSTVMHHCCAVALTCRLLKTRIVNGAGRSEWLVVNE